MKRSLVFLCAVALTTSVLAQRRAVQLPSRISAEFPVSNITYVPGAMGVRPRIAAGPHQALVIWSNGAVRVDELGHPLDPIPMISGLFPWGPQDVVWTGDEYLVVLARWIGTSVAISLVRIGTGGHTGPFIDLETPADPNVNVAMAMNGDELAIVYTTRTSSGTFVANALFVSRTTFTITHRLDLGAATASMASGRVVASPSGYLVLTPKHFDLIGLHGNGVSSGAFPQTDLDAVWNGAEYVIAAADYDGVVTYPMSSSGVIGDSRVVHVAFHSLAPAIAWNGAEYRIVWQDETRLSFSGYVNATFDLFAARIAADRTPLEETRLQKKIWSTDYRFTPGPDGDALAAVGTTFVPVWTAAQRIVYDGSLGSGELPGAFAPELVSRAAQPQSGAGLVATPESARVFWFETDAVLTTSIDPLGHRGSAKSLTAALYPPIIAFNGVDTVALWSTGTSVYVTVIDAAGDVVTQTTLATSAGMHVRAFDCNAHDCAAVWNDDAKTYFQRVSPNGSPIDGPLELTTGFIGLSGRDDEYLLLFNWARNLFATRWADGKLSDVTDLQTNVTSAAIASNADGWLVVAAPTVIRLDAQAQIQSRANLPTVDPYASATWDGRDWIIVWDADGDIDAARMHPDGTLDVPFFVAATKDQEHAPIVRSAGNGLSAVAYWRYTNDRIYGLSLRVFVRWIDNR